MNSDAKSTYETIKRIIELRNLLKGTSLEELSYEHNKKYHSELMDLQNSLQNQDSTGIKFLEIFEEYTAPLDDYLALKESYENLQEDYKYLKEKPDKDREIFKQIINLINSRGQR